MFSIIIPVYNVAPYLRACIDSVIYQSCPDWECICVDDGSTDGSDAILDEYANRYSSTSKIRVVHKSNGGVSSARNVALDLSRGDWVLMLDGDDMIAADLIENLSLLIKGNPKCDTICFGMVYVNEAGEEKGEFAQTGAKAAILSGDELLSKGCGPYSPFLYSSCDKVYRRSLIEKIPLRYEVNMCYQEDSLFSHVYLSYAQFVIMRPDIMGYKYRMRKGSAIHSVRTYIPACPFLFFDILYSHWKKLHTPGLRSILYHSAVGYPYLGKGSGYAPNVRTQAIRFLLSSRAFNWKILPFAICHGGFKARTFAIIYLSSPRCFKRKILEAL